MAIRCKLISPTNLLLEHPMLSPVKETEFLVVGLNEFEKEKMQIFRAGLMSGAALAAGICVLIAMMALAWRDRDKISKETPYRPSVATYRMSGYPIPGIPRPAGSQTPLLCYGKLGKARKMRQIA